MGWNKGSDELVASAGRWHDELRGQQQCWRYPNQGGAVGKKMVHENEPMDYFKIYVDLDYLILCPFEL